MTKNRVIIIGFGHHARRIHYPILHSFEEVEVVGLVDLYARQQELEDYLITKKISVPCLFLKNKKNDISYLTQFAKTVSANCVVISTDPESHVAYAKWAFNNGLHVIIDKPVHAEKNAAHNLKSAKSIHKKYLELFNALGKSRQTYPNLVCEILTQRRHHPAYTLIKDIIDEVYKKTGCPITYYYAFHNDGQWRMPKEINEITYHGFQHGYGKASHSGYHFYDLLNWFSSVYREDYGINNILVKAWPNFPNNYFEQVNSEVLEKVFSEQDDPIDYYMANNLKHFGEIDSMSTIQLRANKKVITHAQIDLQHSGLSARSWSNIENRNLYKGNGRVRHEQHYLNMGPFVAISMTSWQSIPFKTEKIDSSDIFKPGHEFNLDITISRNSRLIGGRPIETFTLKDIYKPYLKDYSRGHQEDARKNAIIEFLELINSNGNSGNSSLESHYLSSLIMSGVYQSMSTQKQTISRL